MQKLILWLALALALSFGGLQVFAAGGSIQNSGDGHQVLAAREQGNDEKAKPPNVEAEDAEDEIGGANAAADEDEADEADDASEDSDEDETGSAALKQDKIKEPKSGKETSGAAGTSGACAEGKVTHGCAVSTAVHEAQMATEAGAGRGIAVSTAAHQADCSMLPEGAQAACAKKAAWEHPNADGIHGNQAAQNANAGAVEKTNGKGQKK